MASTASLVSLPTEIRNEIIQIIFASHATVHNPWYGLLLTNKLFHAEVSDLLKDATLRIRIRPRHLHLPLAAKLENTRLKEQLDVNDWRLGVVHFRDYCKRFRRIAFDVTATQQPTDCRLEPSYERKGVQIAHALTTQLRKELNLSGEHVTVDVIWGSFNRNVYMGITTWDCCVLKGLGAVMATLIARGRAQLSDVLYCAIILEKRSRQGLPVSYPRNADVQIPSMVPPQRRGFGKDLARKIRLAMHG